MKTIEQKIQETSTPPKFNSSPQKMMVGMAYFPFGMGLFSGENSLLNFGVPRNAFGKGLFFAFLAFELQAVTSVISDGLVL